jgi:polysaccharide biosynthesis protein PslG
LATYSIEQIAPNETFIGPGLLHDHLNFLEETFKNNLLTYWDAISVHPYRHDKSPETVSTHYSQFKDLIKKYNSSSNNIPVISGEWGYPKVSWGGISYNEDKQARFLARQWLFNLSQNIPISIWFEWKESSNPDMGWGVVRSKYYSGRNPVYDPKPAYHAAKTLATSLKDYSFSRRIMYGSGADYILEFENVVQSGSSRAYVVWRDASNSTKLNLPIMSGKFNVISHLGKSLGTVSAQSQGIPIEVTSGPKYLIPVP